MRTIMNDYREGSSLLYRLWHHPWTVAVCNIALIFSIYSLSRIFYFLVNKDLYPNVDFPHFWTLFFGGMRFDVTALFYLNSLYMVAMFNPLRIRSHRIYQNITKWLFWLINIVGICVNMVDCVYTRFSGRRTTILFFDEFKHDSNLADIFFHSIFEYWYVTLFTIAVCVLLVYCTRTNTYLRPLTGIRRNVIAYLCETALFCVSVYFIIIGIRSGFGAFTRPLKISNAFQYAKDPVETNIVLNTPFSLLLTVKEKPYVDPKYFEEDELASIFTPEQQPDSTAWRQIRPKNVVIFILESFSKEYIGFYNQHLDSGHYKGYTPFLDSLLDHSITFRHSYSNGRKSIDAMPSILVSLPRFGRPFILTPYSTNVIDAIPRYLSDWGYMSAFFHGAPNGSMGFEAFSLSTGFNRYYGKTEYNNNADYDGYWGIWDEEFLQFYARVMDTLPQPFVTSLFTVSSHHPFQVPKRYENKFPEGSHPLHRCIGYTDFALRQFFNYAKQQPWYQNTLFVLTADHTNVLQYPQYVTAKGVYEVPIIFFDPTWEQTASTNTLNHPSSETTSGNISVVKSGANSSSTSATNTPPRPLGKQGLNDPTPVSQADILPSVLNYLGYDKPFFAFGENVLTASKKHPFVTLYNEPIYQCLSDHLMVQFDGEKIVHIYDFEQDPTLQTDLIDEWQKSAEVADMVQFMKAYLQQYMSRMREDRMSVRHEANE